MLLTAELSVYPFNDNYRELIQAYIQKLTEYEGIKVTPGPTSTVVVGQLETVMACVSAMVQWSHETQGRSVLVAKFLAG